MTALPPSAREAEQALIGATFRDNSLAVTLELLPEDFIESAHQKLWQIAQARVGRGDSFAIGPIIAMAPELEAYLKAISGFGANDRETISGYVSAIKDASVRRRLQGLAQWFSEQVVDQEQSAEELTARFFGEASKLAASRKAQSKRQVAERIYALCDKPAPCFGTGLSVLDDVLGGGLYGGKCVGIAARKKVGKTALAGTISHNLNRRGVKHLYIAGEMSDVEIEQRNMAREMRINSIRFLKGRAPELRNRIADYATQVPDSTVYEHAPGANLDEVKRMVGRAVINHGITGFILDYWQLVGGKARNETEEYHLRNVAQWIADYCKRENLWALVLAQVNQDGNTRGGEGLKLACDVYFTMHREKDQDGAWLEMEESRYVLYANVGSDLNPGLMLNKHGPYFEDADFADGSEGGAA